MIFFKVQLYCRHYLEHTSTNKFVVYFKFKFNLVSYIFYLQNLVILTPENMKEATWIWKKQEKHYYSVDLIMKEH